MDTKIKASFWTDKEVEQLPAESKLALVWMLTNSQINVCGIFQVTERRFAFETGLPAEALWKTVEALPRALKGFKSIDTIYCRNFIRHQLGSGNALTKNNIFRAVVSSSQAIKHPELRDALIGDYPEIVVGNEALSIPFKGVREGEGVREEKENQGIEVQEKGGGWEPNGHQQRINSWFNRRDTTPWSEKERRAFRHLPETSPEDWDSLEDRYTSNSQNYRRREIVTLLNNWQGEIDLANNPNPVNGQQPELPEGRL